MGVQPSRMLAAGWGEFRPAVENAPSGNTPQNRRVEIFFAKSSGEGVPAPAGSTDPLPGAGTATPDNNTPPTRQPDITK